MTQRLVRNAIATCAVLLGLVLADTLRTHAQAPQSNADPRTVAPPSPRPIGPQPADNPQRTLINQYCIACHTDRLKSGGMTLTALTLDDPHQSAVIGE